MDKNEYIKKIAKLKAIIKQATEDIKETQDEYLKQHVRFEIGEKVEIRTPERKRWSVGKNDEKEDVPPMKRFAYIRSAEVFDDGILRYSFFRAKKDGTRSMNGDYLFTNETNETLHKIK